MMNRLQRQALVAFAMGLLAGVMLVAVLVRYWPDMFGGTGLVYGDLYGLAGRPLPPDDAGPVELLPAAVGAFTRGPVEALADSLDSGAGGQAVYTGDAGTVTVRVVRTDSAAVARLVVATNRVPLNAPGVAEVHTMHAGEEPAFVRVRTDDGAARLTWGRGAIVFSAEAAAAVLDAFLADFPY